MAEYLLDKLQEYSKSDYYPLHMPGHKRNLSFFENPYAIDITEIDGFDNLSHAEGILLEAQRRVAKLYGAEESFYLVNGSTCGILAAVSACVRRGDRILMARNSHKAAYHAAFLNGLRVTYLYPETDMRLGMNGAVLPETVRTALQEANLRTEDWSNMPEADTPLAEGEFHVMPAGEPDAAESECSGDAAGEPDAAESECSGDAAGDAPAFGIGGTEKVCGKERGKIRVVLITSPTYDGVVSDIRAIADEVHRAGAILIVDEAHGAHFAMHPYFPESALACGADIVINSLHKTMPSLTQTALLHVQGARVNRDRLRRYLGIYQSSSPSYVLMAGMDACIRSMQEHGKELFDNFAVRVERLRKELGGLRNLYLVTGREPELNAFDFDRSRILISTARCRLNGPELGALLREQYHLESEMEAEQYVTAILTVADTDQGFLRLRDALIEIDQMTGKAGAVPAGVENSADAGAVRADAGNSGEAGAVRANVENSADADTRKPGSQNKEALRLGEFSGQKAGTILIPHPAMVLSMEEADNAPHRTVPLILAGGRVSAEFAYLYPPGIPLIVPGERIPEQLPELLAKYRDMGLSLQGLRDLTGQTIETAEERRAADRKSDERESAAAPD